MFNFSFPFLFGRSNAQPTPNNAQPGALQNISDNSNIPSAPANSMETFPSAGSSFHCYEPTYQQQSVPAIAPVVNTPFFNRLFPVSSFGFNSFFSTGPQLTNFRFDVAQAETTTQAIALTPPATMFPSFGHVDDSNQAFLDPTSSQLSSHKTNDLQRQLTTQKTMPDFETTSAKRGASSPNESSKPKKQRFSSVGDGEWGVPGNSETTHAIQKFSNANVFPPVIVKEEPLEMEQVDARETCTPEMKKQLPMMSRSKSSTRQIATPNNEYDLTMKEVKRELVEEKPTVNTLIEREINTDTVTLLPKQEISQQAKSQQFMEENFGIVVEPDQEMESLILLTEPLSGEEPEMLVEAIEPSQQMPLEDLAEPTNASSLSDPSNPEEPTVPSLENQDDPCALSRWCICSLFFSKFFGWTVTEWVQCKKCESWFHVCCVQMDNGQYSNKTFVCCGKRPTKDGRNAKREVIFRRFMKFF
ncbi:hypothetical protein CRE_27680 [Caenorhabditis remanei]|uniref:Uncharacterized protein n=1 Tax=Caenorhabditis remanei TaxID=31234 RepID=E3MKH1_CAERE|nr:hypothetical protein CRE_27680 [Caenorhabditis remanei]